MPISLECVSPKTLLCLLALVLIGAIVAIAIRKADNNSKDRYLLDPWSGHAIWSAESWTQLFLRRWGGRHLVGCGLLLLLVAGALIFGSLRLDLEQSQFMPALVAATSGVSVIAVSKKLLDDILIWDVTQAVKAAFRNGDYSGFFHAEDD